MSHRFSRLHLPFVLLISAGMMWTTLSGCASSTAKTRQAAPVKTETSAQVAAEQESANTLAPSNVPEPERHASRHALGAGQSISIVNPFGDVRLRFGGYSSEVEVSAVQQRLDSTVPRFRFAPAIEQQSLLIAPSLPAGARVQKGQRIDIVVFVPKSHPVRVQTTQGLIEVRGVKSDVRLQSEGGAIALRGVEGLVDVTTEGGTIEASFDASLHPKSTQRLQSKTGSIVVAVTDRLNANVIVATSAPISTEYSLDIERQDGKEPNKRARAVVGTPAANFELLSLRGPISILRKIEFIEVPADSQSVSPGG